MGSSRSQESLCSLILPRLPLLSLQDVIIGHALASLGSLPGTAPAHALLRREVEILVKGVAVPVRGLASCALAPRTVCGLVDEGTLAVTCHAALLPVCGFGGPRSRSSDRYQDRRVCSRSSGRCEAQHDRSRSHGSRYRSRDRSPLSSDRLRSRERRWQPGQSHRDRATLGQELRVAPFLDSRPPCQAVPQPVRVPGAAGYGSGVFIYGCWCHRCWGAAWPCRSGDIRSPCCLFVCECAHSRCDDSRWCCLCNRFARST